MYKPGDVIGPYRIVSKLGSGAFGIVWLADRTTSITTTKVALKMPTGDVTFNEVNREAQIWVQASGHPNVLPIIEAELYNDQIVIASEYAADGSLMQLMERNANNLCPVDKAIEIVLGILSGLEHLHSKRIIHRDLKPANILLQGEHPRLADFGIARLIKTTSRSMAAGTPAYMAPEAFEGKRSEQTDIWSVGVIFYQLLSAKLPFMQPDYPSLAYAIMSKPYDPLPPTVPIPIQTVIERALRKDPSERYLLASEMKQALLLARQGIMPEIVPSRTTTNINTYSQLSANNLPKTEVITQTPTSISLGKKLAFSVISLLIIGFALIVLYFFKDKILPASMAQGGESSPTPAPQVRQTPLVQSTPTIIVLNNTPTPIASPTPIPTPQPSQTPMALSSPMPTPNIEPQPNTQPTVVPQSSPTPTTTPNASNIPINASSNLIAKVQDFTFELRECRLANPTISCDVYVTNTKNDRILKIYGADYGNDTKIFDNANNEYIASKVQIANKAGNHYTEILLVSGVQTKINLQFNNVAPEATRIKRLYLQCESGEKFQIVLGDIPLVRQ